MDDAAHFLVHWFSGLCRGLDRLDGKGRAAILRECGRACSESYTMGVFKEMWQGSHDMPSFLAGLAKRFPGAAYRLLNEDLIEVTYAKCDCDLVVKGLVKSAVLCSCSAYNLEENFGAALDRPVAVEMKGSILSGDAHCRFVVTLGRADVES